MNILYFDCQAGISGDMTVGALLDLGVPLEHLHHELAKLPLGHDSYILSASHTERQHLPALKFDVEVHDHHTHRHYAGIDAMIAGSTLSEPVKGKARRIFRRLAEAEAHVHGVAVEDVHFHEVGAVDSIVDIVGTALCLEYLKVEQVYASAVPLGSGFVETAHGRLPVPAPATAELLKGYGGAWWLWRGGAGNTHRCGNPGDAGKRFRYAAGHDPPAGRQRRRQQGFQRLPQYPAGFPRHKRQTETVKRSGRSPAISTT